MPSELVEIVLVLVPLDLEEAPLAAVVRAHPLVSVEEEVHLVPVTALSVLAIAPLVPVILRSVPVIVRSVRETLLLVPVIVHLALETLLLAQEIPHLVPVTLHLVQVPLHWVVVLILILLLVVVLLVRLALRSEIQVISLHLETPAANHRLEARALHQHSEAARLH